MLEYLGLLAHWWHKTAEGKTAVKRMCQAFPCILSLNTFCRLGDLLLLSFIFPWAPVITSTQALPGGLGFVWEAVSLGTSLALRRLGEVKRAQTV